MRNEKGHSEHKIGLPKIQRSHSQSLMKRNSNKEFTLRFVNEHMPTYDPSKDKFLHNYFDRQIRQKRISESFKEKKSIKTLPTEGEQQERKPQRLTTLNSECYVKQKGVKQLSKQEFSNYMQMMKAKLQKR